MKKIVATFIAAFVLTLVSTAAIAHPGSHSLICKSAAHSGSKQVIAFNLHRANGKGWAPPTYDITVDGKKIEFTTDDEMKTLGETYHNSPLGVITVSADNFNEQNTKNHGSFFVVAIPGTVKAFDINGKPVKWNFKNEQNDCNDSNGKAKFQGIFHGYMNQDDKDVQVDTQLMDCELEYNSGMAC